MRNKYVILIILISTLLLISLIGNVCQYKLSKDKEEKTETLKENNVIPELHPIEIQVQKCMKKENYTTSGMSECMDDSIQNWNNEIKKNILQSKKYLNEKEFALLLDNQKKWEAYKESQFSLIEKTYYETKALIYLNYASGDRAALVKDRANYLLWFLDIMQKR